MTVGYWLTVSATGKGGDEMQTLRSRHADTRARQRAIPPLIELWLDEFGEVEHDGHGGVRRYFSHRSIRRMEREFGSRPVSRMAEYLGVYKVERNSDGVIITVGHRTRRFRRR